MNDKVSLLKENMPHEECIYRALCDSSYFAIIAVASDGYFVYMNDKARELLDFEYDGCMTDVHCADVDGVTWQEYQKIIATGETQIGVSVDGFARPLVAHRTPIMWEGDVIGVISVFQDMQVYEDIFEKMATYQRCAEEVEAIIGSSYDGIYVTDGKANTIRINSAYEKITGINATEVIGRNMRDLVQEGFYDESVTLKVLETQQTVTINQSLKTGKDVLATGNPIFDDDGTIIMVVTNVRDMTDLVELNRQLEYSTELKGAYKQQLQDLQRSAVRDDDLVMVSEAMLYVYEMVDRVCGTDATVLIYGETGVGKDRIAEEIHDKSPRAEKGIFVKINCGAIPETLLESELFGYESGAFTGAKKEGKVGLFEVADGGTLFLDEVESMPMVLQSKLLRVLQNFEITRVGGIKPKKVDVRLICASNRDLQDLIEKKEFRADLYYRLNVVPVYIPPLRERREDIPPLADLFLSRYNRKHGKKKKMSREVFDLLRDYPWPGNVREVANLIERLVVVTPGDMIRACHLPPEFDRRSRLNELAPGTTLKEYLEKIEMNIILNAVRDYGNARRAAPYLGVDATTLTRKIKKYNDNKRV